MKPEHRVRLSYLVLAALVLALVAPPRQASLTTSSIIYVDADAIGDENGTSWADAFIDLQVALEVAISGDQIWVAEGTYKPSVPTSRLATFQLLTGVALYGGFDPSQGDDRWEERDWVSNATTLSGDIGLAGEHSDDSFHVVTADGVDVTTILDGFTIRESYANQYTPNDRGGGIYNTNGSPTLNNLIITHNAARYGGGIYNSSGNPTLTNVTVSTNYAEYGGGMYNSNSHPTLIESTFLGNNAAEDGGGMINDSSSPSLTDVTFYQNSTDSYGGGMANRYGSNPILRHVAFIDNYASGSGGGMSNVGNSVPDIQYVNFSSNEAYYYGGGIYNDQSSSVLVNVIFRGNTAGYGGGMYNSDCSPILVNGAFSENHTSDEGGGINNMASSPTLINVTFSGNTASNGGGMYNQYGDSTLTNAILWGNTPNQIVNDESVLDVSYSDIQDGWPGIGNINLDPQFVNTYGGDLRLQFNSPVIDAGDNSMVPSGITTDLLGMPRFVDVLSVLDTGFDTPPIVDMGAYEVQAVVVYLTIVTK